MNFRHLLALLAITLGVFSSCGDDTSVPSDKPDKPGTSDVTTIQLQLSAEVSLPDVILPDGTRSMDFDVSQAIPRVLESSTWDTHMFLRKKGDDSFVGYAYVQWNVLGRGEDGRLRLKSNGTTISIQNANGNVPLNGEDWYIAGVAGGGEVNSDRTAVNFGYNEALDGSLPFNRVRVPFSFAWTKLDIDAANLSTATVTMKPQGSLINLIATNSTGKELDEVLAAGFELQSTNLDREGYFDYSSINNTITNIEANAMPSWKFTNTTPVLNKHRVKFSGDNGTQSNWLVWGMPRTDASPNTTMKGYRNVYIKGTRTLMTSNRQFTAGLAYYAYVDIKEYGTGLPGNKAPYEFIRGFVNAAGNGIVPLDDKIQNFDSRIGYFTPAQASKYDLPSYFELALVYASDSALVAGSNQYADGKTEDYQGPQIGFAKRFPDDAKFGGVQLKGYYRHTAVVNTQYDPGQITYAMRFIGSNGDNSKRVAVRHYVDEYKRHQYYMKYVGDAPNITMYTIMQESFWKTYDKKIVVPNLKEYLGDVYNGGRLEFSSLSAMPYDLGDPSGYLYKAGTLSEYDITTSGESDLRAVTNHIYFKETYKGVDYAHAAPLSNFTRGGYDGQVGRRLILLSNTSMVIGGATVFGRIPYRPELLTGTYPILLIDKK